MTQPYDPSPVVQPVFAPSEPPPLGEPGYREPPMDPDPTWPEFPPMPMPIRYD